MSGLEEPARRRSNPEITASRRALNIVSPFSQRFGEWNDRAARATGAILSAAVSSEDKKAFLDEIAALREEVGASYAKFQAAVSRAPAHSRIDDVRHAYTRLLAMLDM